MNLRVNFGTLYGHPHARKYDQIVRAVTLFANLRNDTGKAIVATRFTAAHLRYAGAPRPTFPEAIDNFWRIPPGREVHFMWHQGIRRDQGPPPSQTITCKLFAVRFEDGSSWAATPGNVAPGDAERHHGPL
ncbi:MAG: hypothetical protein NVS9B12_14150 [Vulcanimicrobiaceae bacterium]